MKLMGRHRLYQLARSQADLSAGAIGALAAELEVAEWSTPDDARALFPQAVLSGDRLRISIRPAYAVVVQVNCAAGVALVKYAGCIEGAQMEKAV